MAIQAKRYHDICAGHRVVGHEGKCRNLHGHNYRITFTVEAKEDLGDCDSVGRVLDFSVIASTLCEWLEHYWDHRMLLWEKDPLVLGRSDGFSGRDTILDWDDTIVVVPFNPTAEHIGMYLIQTVGPQLLENTRARLVRVEVEETRKCTAIVEG